jgi:hypothetical protein
MWDNGQKYLTLLLYMTSKSPTLWYVSKKSYKDNNISSPVCLSLRLLKLRSASRIFIKIDTDEFY